MLLLIIVVLGGAGLYYVLAVQRGVSRSWAAFWAILLGPFALLLLLLPKRVSLGRRRR
jgi:hypothetical protein